MFQTRCNTRDQICSGFPRERRTNILSQKGEDKSEHKSVHNVIRECPICLVLESYKKLVIPWKFESKANRMQNGPNCSFLSEMKHSSQKLDKNSNVPKLCSSSFFLLPSLVGAATVFTFPRQHLLGEDPARGGHLHLAHPFLVAQLGEDHHLELGQHRVDALHHLVVPPRASELSCKTRPIVSSHKNSWWRIAEEIKPPHMPLHIVMSRPSETVRLCSKNEPEGTRTRSWHNARTNQETGFLVLVPYGS